MQIDTDLLNAALIGLEARRRELDERIADVQARLKGNAATPIRSGLDITTHSVAKPAVSKPAKRKMSAAGRARIVAAAKKRWAAIHAAKRAKAKAKAKPKPRAKKSKPAPEATEQVA